MHRSDNASTRKTETSNSNTQIRNRKSVANYKINTSKKYWQTNVGGISFFFLSFFFFVVSPLRPDQQSNSRWTTINLSGGWTRSEVWKQIVLTKWNVIPIYDTGHKWISFIDREHKGNRTERCYVRDILWCNKIFIAPEDIYRQDSFNMHRPLYDFTNFSVSRSSIDPWIVDTNNKTDNKFYWVLWVLFVMISLFLSIAR